jgi:hypothetical protein
VLRPGHVATGRAKGKTPVHHPVPEVFLFLQKQNIKMRWFWSNLYNFENQGPYTRLFSGIILAISNAWTPPFAISNFRLYLPSA